MALIKCSECGNMLSDKATACPKCGAPVVITIKCDECGEVVPLLSASCPNCGAPSTSSMRKCEECGQMIPNGSSSCLHCGYSFTQGKTLNLQSNKQMDYIVSEEVNRFNWGAFCLWHFWGCANGMPYTIFIWLVLLALNVIAQYDVVNGSGSYFPLILLLIVSFIISFDFGFRGGRWAWEKKQWRDFEHFRAVQRSWRHWALGIFLFSFLVGFVVGFFIVMSKLNG